MEDTIALPGWPAQTDSFDIFFSLPSFSQLSIANTDMPPSLSPSLPSSPVHSVMATTSTVAAAPAFLAV